MRAKEISEALANEAAAIARELLPNGQQQGNEWCVGSIAGEEGKSLKVCISGTKAGVWMDFADSGKNGDLLDLWIQVKNCALTEAMRQACNFLGISQPKPYRQKEKSYKSPLKPKTMVRCHEAPETLQYLTEVRGLTRTTLEAFQIYGDKEMIYFPFIRNGKTDMIKQMKIKRVDGKKDIRPTSKDQLKCLFGWQTISPGSREAVICEGELNAMSVKQIGFDALSVPFGAGNGEKQAWVENEFDNLERFDTIYLWFDNDDAGKAAIPELVDRLGCERCRVIEHRCDANDALNEGMNNEGLMALLVNSTEQTPSSLCRLKEFETQIWDELQNPYAFTNGFRLPWSKVGTSFIFRPGEVTVLTGVNGHGKSAGAGEMVVSVLEQGGCACVAGLESRPHKWLVRMLKQYQARQLGENSLSTREGFSPVFDWFNENLIVYGSPGQGVCNDILEVFRYSRRRYGATFFLLDNLSALNVPLDDYEGQRKFIQKLVNFAKTENVHILLVTHMRKPEDDSKPGNKFGIKGSGSLSDLADNVLIWWRNRRKEQKIREGALVNRHDPDALLICDKQRETGVEPTFKLWFNPEYGNFLEEPATQPTSTEVDEWEQVGRA